MNISEQLGSFLTIPDFADPMKYRRTQMFRSESFALFVSSLLLIALCLVTGAPPIMLFSFVLMGFASILFFILMKKKHVLLAAFGFVTSIWILLIVLTVYTGGFNSSFLPGTLITIMLATMILGGTWGIFFAILDIAAVLYFSSPSANFSQITPVLQLTREFYITASIALFSVTGLIMAAACFTITKVIQRLQTAEARADNYSETAKHYFEFTPALMLRLDADGRLMVMNNTARQFFECSTEDILNKPLADYIENEHEQALLRQSLEQLKFDQNHDEIILENSLTNINNESKSFRWRIKSIHKDNGVLDSFLLSGEDLSEIKKSREIISLSDNLLERVGSLLLVSDAEGQIEYAGPSVKQILGFEPEELLGDGWWNLTRNHPDAEEESQAERTYLSGAASGGIDIIQKPYERKVYDKFGNPHWILWQDSLVPGNRIIGVGQDITERKFIEESLEQSRTSMKQLVDNMQEGVYKIAMDGTIEFANEKLAQLHGFKSAKALVGKNVSELEFYSTYPNEEFMESLIEKGVVRNFQSTWVNRKNEKIYTLENATLILDEEGNPTAYDGTVLDITDQKRLESQFLQSQKMEAIGRVTGTVAHDFNNLLTIIKGYGTLALSDVQDNDKLKNQLMQIVDAGTRAESLTSQLLTFSRKEDVSPVTIDLNMHLSKIEEMLRRLIGEDIELVTRFKDEILPIHIDTSQLEQIIMNLFVNARDAMPDGGTLILETERVHFPPLLMKAEKNSTLSGDFILLSISDTGVGMNKEVQEKIFEPFYTTKDKGKGTGLGLSTVYGIVKQCSGDIHLYSEEGIGTTFKIYLPQAVETLTATKSTRSEDTANLRGEETILVVEDEADVLSFVMDTLTNYGYKVYGSDDSEKAFSLYRSMDSEIDMVVSDVILPKVSGPELVRKILVSKPAMKVLYMSGYSEAMIGKHGLVGNEINFIQKPFSPYELTRKIRESIDLKS